MSRKIRLAWVLTGMLLGSSLPALAQDRADAPMNHDQSMQGGAMHGMGHHGRMHGGMDRCRMMHGKMGHGGMMGMPMLPPGNEKLQLQMQAEMMQRMGEILAKYAARIQEPPKP